jgi:TolB-like protein
MTARTFMGATVLAWIIVVLLLSGCLSVRSDFMAVGEEEILNESFQGDLYAWTFAQVGQFTQVKDEKKSFLRFLSGGGISLENSLVSDFRMEFEVRLEAPVEYDMATAMINFRNFFNKRYCLIIEPDVVYLTVARIRHNELMDLAEANTLHTLNRWYKYEIVAVGNNIKVFKNDVLILDVPDPDSSVDSGNIFFESHSKYSFTNVKISRIDDFVELDSKTEEQPQQERTFPPDEKITVAVGDFENLGVPSYEISLLSDLYSYSLLSTGVFRVLERKELKKVLSEQELQLSDITEEEGSAEIGRILNSNYLSTGSIGKLGEQYIITLKLIEIETGETLISTRKELSDPEAISAVLRSLSEEIARKLIDH